MTNNNRSSLINTKFTDRPPLNNCSLFIDREYGFSNYIAQRRLQFAYVDALEQEAVLEGHDGCVNCLEWNWDGSVLASCSDDYHVILWDPFRRKRLHSIHTKHVGNMFSVKFLPRHNENIIATGAADKYIYVYDINRGDDALMQCNCHLGRVKRLATSPELPFVFWSAGEDGIILQIDIRESHRCREKGNRVQLLNLTACVDPTAEAKCLAINPRRTEYLAVGANDPYARIYDRRMLKLISSYIGDIQGIRSNGDPLEKKIPKDCVAYYCPGHINMNNSRYIDYEPRAITYLTFNEAGNELLVNIGAEHIYLYDLQSAEQPIFLNLPEYKSSPDEELRTEKNCNKEVDSTNTNSETASSSKTSSTSAHRRKVPEHVEVFKKLGNEFLENEKYLNAINQYSEAISLAPKCPVLYLNRATAYMRRAWYGDIYAALRDCHEALKLDPSYIKAHFRLARALLELERPQEAEQCLKELINRFPSYANNHGVLMLHKDIKENRQAEIAHPQEPYSYMELSDNEYLWRRKAKDYAKRFLGHCNTTTDIKEANYLGYDGDFIAAGSDDGNFFIWERKTGNVRAIYKADAAIVNCVQPHPYICLLATSGIDHDIKLWTPIAPPSEERPNVISHATKCVEDNQLKMRTDPFDINTRNYCWNG